jgi:pyruvate dehydrogenase E1 component alpha subunit
MIETSVDLLQAMVRNMILARTFDTAATNLQRQGELALWPSMLGQEAAQAGLAAALGDSDVLFPTYREHGVLLSRGITPIELLGLYRGTSLGDWDPHKFNCFLATLVIGAHALHGVGYAMGIQRDAQRSEHDSVPGRAVVVCLGDGSFSQGETNEAFIWSATRKAPVVFFCQNNQWAISTPFSTQSIVPLVERGKGFGIPSIQVDGNDAIAVYEATKEALERARNDGGPTLIEAVTYRINAHTTSDDDTLYRTDDDKQQWRDKDPIDVGLARLREMTPNADQIIDEIQSEAKILGERVRSDCRSLPNPDPRDPFKFTLTQQSRELQRQEEIFVRYTATSHVRESAT